MRCSRLLLDTSYASPRISHFSKKLWFLSLENVLETKAWVRGVLVVTGVSLPPHLLSWWNKEIYVYILASVYTRAYKYFHMYLSICLSIYSCIYCKQNHKFMLSSVYINLTYSSVHFFLFVFKFRFLIFIFLLFCFWKCKMFTLLKSIKIYSGKPHSHFFLLHCIPTNSLWVTIFPSKY